MFCDSSSIYSKLINDDELQKPIHLHHQSSVIDLMHQPVVDANGDVMSYADFSDKLKR